MNTDTKYAIYSVLSFIVGMLSVILLHGVNLTELFLILFFPAIMLSVLVLVVTVVVLILMYSSKESVNDDSDYFTHTLNNDTPEQQER